MNEPRLENLPLILETPIDKQVAEGKSIEDKGIWVSEIKLLESLIGMDPTSSHFNSLKEELAAKGSEERKKYAEAFEKKLAKEKRIAEKGQTKLQFSRKRQSKSERSEQ